MRQTYASASFVYSLALDIVLVLVSCDCLVREKGIPVLMPSSGGSAVQVRKV